MKRAILLLCALLSACVGGGSLSGPGEPPSGPGEPSGAASMQDTPPIAGPSEDQDAKPEIPIGECKEENGVNCPEKLAVSRANLCARTGTTVNPVVTGSEAVASSSKPIAADGHVTLKIWPATDLAGSGMVVAPDGTVTFHLVAGQKTGYYEFWVFGDLDTAYGELTVETCGDEAPGDTLAPNPPPPPPPQGPAFKAK